MSILDLRGPEFLQTYVTLLAGAVIAGFLLRRLMRGPADQHPSWTPTLGPLEVAYLSRGPRGATDAAIASLAHRNVIRVRGAPAMLFTGDTARPSDLTPLEDVICDTAGATGTVREARAVALPHAKALSRELERLEFVLPPDRHMLVRLAPAALLLVVLALGVAKVFVGASRGRPVEFLVFLCVGTLVVIALMLSHCSQRTVRGSRFLKELRDRNAALQTTAKASPSRLEYGDLAMAFALFGPAVLAHEAYADLRREVGHTPSGGSCGSSCGGGGSSCGGGGGCGGGGCGGCGGS